MIFVVDTDEQRLDRVAKALYGSEQGGTVELLLAANPGLAWFGPYLPRGTTITAPDRPEPKPNPAYTRPWE